MPLAAAFLAGAALGGAAVWRRSRAARARDARLLSFALHELNTPATAVNMTLINLLSGVFGEVPPDQQKWLEMARDQMGRMNGLIGEVRDFLHMEFHRDLKTAPEPTGVAEVVENALVAHRGGFAQANLELKTEVAEGLPLVSADPDRTARTLASLISHARKFRVSGPVTVSARPGTRGVVFAVAYTSKPLPPERFADSLELYYPAVKRRDQLLTATGLGLGFLRALSRRAGAELAYSGDAAGGARLELTVPRAERNA